MLKASLFLVLCLSMVCNAWYPASGTCAFNLNYKGDYNLAIKHFCPGCNSAQDAINFSVVVKRLTIFYILKILILIAQFYLQRNQYCLANGCARAGTNTVFIADILNFPNLAYLGATG